MNLLQHVQEKAGKKVPIIRPGYTVKVHQKIREGEKTRTQIFEGLVIKVNSGYGADRSFTVRKVVEGIGVEKIFPLYSSNIEKIEVTKKSKIRRAKLYYMRERSGKSARLKERFVSQKELAQDIDPLGKKVAEAEEKAAAEAAKAEEAKKKAEEAEAAKAKEAAEKAAKEAAKEVEPAQEEAKEQSDEAKQEPTTPEEKTEEKS